MTTVTLPVVIFLVNGKRKSGKDYICEKVKMRLSDETCAIIRISEPLKAIYAEQHNLDLKELLSDGPYKEKYRLDMINWSEEIRKDQPGYFCEAACATAPIKPVWIVSDVRRKTDIKWFKETYGCRVKTIKITANDKVRMSRGWVYTEGVDDAKSECDLDDISKWDLEISNNSIEECDKAINEIVLLVRVLYVV